MAHWNIERGYADLGECVASGLKFDVASICTPTSDHADTLARLLDTPVRGVFCEKPVSSDIRATRRLVGAYRTALRPLAVNYTRRWNSSIAALRDEILAGKLGAVLSGAAYYDRGILHHGSHMIDLIQLLLGPLTLERCLGVRSGHTKDDPLCEAVLRTAAGTRITLHGVDAGDVGIFELQLIFERSIVSLEDFSRLLRTRKADSEPLIPGRERFGVGVKSETDWRRSLYRAFDNFYAAVTTGAPLASDGGNALAAEELCAEIRHLASSCSNQVA